MAESASWGWSGIRLGCPPFGLFQGTTDYKTSGQTQNSLEGIHISSGLRTPQDSPGGAGKYCWRGEHITDDSAANLLRSSHCYFQWNSRFSWWSSHLNYARSCQWILVRCWSVQTTVHKLRIPAGCVLCVQPRKNVANIHWNRNVVAVPHNIFLFV